MGDKDDCNAAFRNGLHDGDQLSSFRLGQNCGGLVKNQQLHTGFVNFPGDFHELHIANGETLNQSVLADAQADAVQCLPGVGGHTGHIQCLQILAQNAADGICLGDFTVQLDVLCNCKAGQQHKLLVNHADALGHGVLRGGDVHFAAVYEDFTLKAACAVNHGHTEQGVHQGGFACAVFAEQGMNLTGLHCKRNITQNCIVAIPLGNVFHFQHIFALHSLCSSFYNW